MAQGKLNHMLNGLLAYWKFDEGASNTPATTADATGNGWTGTNIGGITFSGGKNNSAVNIVNPSTQGISISSSLDARAATTPFSVSFWFQPGVPISGAAVIGEWGTRNDFILFNSSGTVVTFRASDGAGSTTDVATGTLTPFTWYHIVFGFDGSNIFIYVNNGAPTTAVKSEVRRSGGNFVVGNYQSFTLGWTGIYDEVAYYNRALSAADVATLYNGGAGFFFDSFTI